MKKKLKQIFAFQKGENVKINYAGLKSFLGYEDFFYAKVLKPVADECGYEISFDKEFVVLRKKK